MEDKECVWCDRTLAICVAVIGLGFLYMAADVLLDGRIARSLVRGTHLAPVLNMPAAEEPGA
jgi:hypothetical protein